MLPARHRSEWNLAHQLQSCWRTISRERTKRTRCETMKALLKNRRRHPRRPRRSANDPCEICQDCRIERESQRNLESRIVTSSTIVTDRFGCDPTHFVQGLQNVVQILRNGVPSLQQQKHRMCNHEPRNDEGSCRLR